MFKANWATAAAGSSHLVSLVDREGALTIANRVNSTGVEAG